MRSEVAHKWTPLHHAVSGKVIHRQGRCDAQSLGAVPPPHLPRTLPLCPLARQHAPATTHPTVSSPADELHPCTGFRLGIHQRGAEAEKGACRNPNPLKYASASTSWLPAREERRDKDSRTLSVMLRSALMLSGDVLPPAAVTCPPRRKDGKDCIKGCSK